MKVLEFYSGIGGMHHSLLESGVPGEILLAVDINPVANTIYRHNFPNVKLLHRNVQSLSVEFLNSLGADTILMSPPCQPFTRNGLQGDVNDERTASFKYILEVLPLLNIQRVLMENVKGFEQSQMRDLFIGALEKCGFVFQEFILSPHQLGVPNSRHRYYCIAKKSPETLPFPIGTLKTQFPDSTQKECFPISDILENDSFQQYLLSDKILSKYINLLDICHPNSTNSCCFTKAYGRFVEGTGSVFTEVSKEFLEDVKEKIQQLNSNSDEYLRLVHTLELRYFTPREVCRIMNFPETFTFPEDISNRQKYMVLGNSLNCKVVAQLIKLLS